MQRTVWTCDVCGSDIPTRPDAFFAVVEQPEKGSCSQENLHACASCFDRVLHVFGHAARVRVVARWRPNG